MADDEITIQNLVTFQLGDLPDDSIALLLAYATSPEKLSRREMESFVIGMTRDVAANLADALKQKLVSPPTPPIKQSRH